MTASWQPDQLGSEWQSALRLHPLYCALARECVIDLLPCADLEARKKEDPPQATVLVARAWFDEMDERIRTHQLRQFLQTSLLADEQALLELLVHHLAKSVRHASDRDKIDFLLVQYFSLSSSSEIEDREVDAAYVARLLEPALGRFKVSVPSRLKGLDRLIERAKACRTLNELFTSRILEEGKKLKFSAADSYFEPAGMVACARFNFLLRRVFFRLMHQDLTGILEGLRELETRGVSVLDCRKAQFSSEEPTARLRMICQSWKVMFQAEYGSGQPLGILVDLRKVVESALARGTQEARPSRKGSRKGSQAHAAAAGGSRDGSAGDLDRAQGSNGSGGGGK